MAQIIKQPNGKLCLFSTRSDCIIAYDLTKQEIVDIRLQEQRERIMSEVEETLNKIEQGIPAYYQFTHTYEDALSVMKMRHGEEFMLEVKATIESGSVK